MLFGIKNTLSVQNCWEEVAVLCHLSFIIFKRKRAWLSRDIYN